MTGFDPAVPACEPPQTHAIDLAANTKKYHYKFNYFVYLLTGRLFSHPLYYGADLQNSVFISILQ
jgi:hypothetical protein